MFKNGFELEKFLKENVRNNQGKTINDMENEAKNKTKLNIPDDLELFKEPKRDINGDPEKFSIVGSIDPFLNPELFTQKSRKALATEAKQLNKPLRILFSYSSEYEGDAGSIILDLDKKNFSKIQSNGFIDGKQAYSIIKYLVENNIEELISEGEIWEVVQQVYSEQELNGNAIYFPTHIDKELHFKNI